MSPGAVIKATLESARSYRREQLIPGPPADLLEDRADAVAFKHGHTLQSRAPRSYPPVSNGSVRTPGVAMPASMPAHFMTPRYSDPPATSVTSSQTIAGRPALSWAVALLGCGLFVGALAVAMLRSDDTTASFVDPSRASKRPSPAAAPVAAAPAQPGMTQPGFAPAQQAVPAKDSTDTPTSTAPVGAFGSNSVIDEPAVPADAPHRAAGAAPRVAFAPVTVKPATPKAAAPQARPAPAWKPLPEPAAAPPAPKVAAKPAPLAEEEPAPKKTTAKKSAKGSDAADDETKKALEALQKAQLESASSFGEK